MYTWLVVEGEEARLVPAAMARVWQGGAESAELSLPARGKAAALAFVWPEEGGARARRSPRWPDLLAEWSEIYGEALYPGDAMPVLAEEVSAMGADALLLHVAPGLAGATVAWYERGALVSYEHVGGATVAWTEADGLGRPMAGGARGAALSAARKLASAREELVLDRIEQTARATGEALIGRALFRFLAADPPAFDELAGLLARAPITQIAAQRRG